jgi:hypothetical protein
MEQHRHTYANGDVYEGEWEHGEQNGQGTMRYANGDVYEGEWEHGEQNGQGTMRYANGNVYEGEWEHGEQGQGTMRYANGNVYEGEWAYGEWNGQGTMTSVNGNVYEGECEYGEWNGQGTMRYANGDVYEGEWEYGQRNGQGTMRYANGNVDNGQWEEGQFLGQFLGEVVDILPPVRPIQRGLAFEIHDAADKINKDKYYELLQIDLPKEHYASIDMVEYIKGQFRHIIREKMPEKEATLDAILDKAKDLINANKVFVGRTVDFVMKQSDDFKELYLSSFILDCAEAYDGGHDTMSCAKGIFERINMSLIPPLTAISFQCDETPHEDCVKYKNLFRLLTQTINMQDIIKEWANKPDIQDMSAEERKEDLIAFITSKYVELGMTPPTEMIQAKADELDYVFKDLAWGRRKHGTKRRTRKHGTKRRTRKHGTKRRKSKKHVTLPRKYITKRKMKKN